MFYTDLHAHTEGVGEADSLTDGGQKPYTLRMGLGVVRWSEMLKAGEKRLINTDSRTQLSISRQSKANSLERNLISGLSKRCISDQSISHQLSL